MHDKNKNIKVSVIIPVYNAGQYLSNVYHMLLHQTFSNFETIFVDDCSTDESLNIIKKLCSMDNRFKYISHEKNSGCAIARNSGIKIAEGKYIMCLDVDDEYSKDLLMEMYLSISETGSDVAVCDSLVKNITDGQEKTFGQWKRIQKIAAGGETLTIKQPIQYDNICNLIDYVAWSKMIRTDFFKKNNLWFYPLKYYEDIPYSFLSCFLARQIVFVNKKLIKYFMKRENGMTSWSIPKEYNMIYAFDKIIQRKNEYDWDKVESDFMVRILNNIVSVYNSKDINKDDKEKIHYLFKEEYSEKWGLEECLNKYLLNENVKFTLLSFV